MLLQGSVGGDSVLPPLLGGTSGQEGSASCSVCGKTFTGYKYKFRLRRHLIIHTGEKPYACPYCPHRANIRTNLNRHVFVQHSVVLTTTNSLPLFSHPDQSTSTAHSNIPTVTSPSSLDRGNILEMEPSAQDQNYSFT